MADTQGVLPLDLAPDPEPGPLPPTGTEQPAPVVRPRPPAPDQAGRDLIATALDRTLFVEAGAGSGKTTALVDRITALVETGAAGLESVAAITFTEKAGAELRDRLRQSLGSRLARSRPGAHDVDDAAAARCRAALDALDGAAIGTLHAFAQRLLNEHPVEAGIPPRVEVLDEVASGVQFQRRWRRFLDDLLADPAEDRPLALLFACGLDERALRALAVAFDQNWDLVAERVPARAEDPPPVAALVGPALRRLQQACVTTGCCRDPEDKLAVRLRAVSEFAGMVLGLADEAAILEALDPGRGLCPSLKMGNIGRAGLYSCDLKAHKALVQSAAADLEEARLTVARLGAARLGSAIRRFTLASADERRAAGRLEFHDLLVMARALLRDPTHGAAVRRRLHQRYTHLLLDEFQDTDPIQIELAVRIAAAEPDSEHAGSAPWDEVEVAPGHLFVVGDPKQSIYRFRRADIGVFLAARDRFGAGGSAVVELTANFRTTAPVVHWVNRTFAELIGAGDPLPMGIASQPAYRRLDPVRPAPPVGPAVAAIGKEPLAGGLAEQIRSAEAADVVATVARAVTEGWSVDDGLGGFRPARLGDVAILIPARTSLPFLEDALDGAGIAYRTESSSLVYASRAVRDLVMVLRAATDPTDELAIISALRTPLLGCGDDDLYQHRAARGGWDHTAGDGSSGDLVRVSSDGPVAAGLTLLREVYERSRWQAPSELLGFIAAERRAFELGFAEGRPRDVWRRLRFVIDQARAWHGATGGTARDYLAWVTQQTAEGARVAESVLPETDDDAVRILTIHAAKGLEFPITIVSGLSTKPTRRPAAAEVVFPPSGGVGYRLGSKVSTEEYEQFAPIDEQMTHDERIRLLYVACTRARDHLVVSLYRVGAAPADTDEGTKHTNAQLIVRGMGDALDDLPDVGGGGHPLPSISATPVPPPLPQAEWEAERTRALTAAGQVGTVAATALADERREPVRLTAAGPTRASGPDEAEASLASDPEGAEPADDPGLAKRPRDLDLPPWLKGRYGTAVGRAVHGVLQAVDLAAPADTLDGLVAAQSEAEAVGERVADVKALVESALGTSTVSRAAHLPHWREVYACVPVGDRLLEGYVDLLYRDPEAGGLVVVDYKTSASADPAHLARRLADYRRQGAAYALAVGEATGEPVVRVEFVFLTPDGARVAVLADLAREVDDVRRLVEQGAESAVAG